MKKENNKIVVILLGIIIILLGAITGLLATKTITFNTKSNNETKENKEEKSNDESNDNKEEDKYIISYEKEEYTTKRSDGTESTKSTRNLPKITNSKNQEAANKIVKFLTDISNQNWEDNIKKVANDSSELPYSDLGVTYLYETGIETDNRLTFTLKMNGGFGGVSWLAEEGYNFDKKTGELLTFDTISTNKDELEQYLLKKTKEKIEELRKRESNCINDDYQKNLEEISKNGNWYFTSSEIIIKLQKYTIACGAGGITEINISKEDVNQYLKDEYKI